MPVHEWLESRLMSWPWPGSGARVQYAVAWPLPTLKRERPKVCANTGRARLWVKTDDDPDSCWDPGSKWFPGVPKFRECFHKQGVGCRARWLRQTDRRCPQI